MLSKISRTHSSPAPQPMLQEREGPGAAVNQEDEASEGISGERMISPRTRQAAVSLRGLGVGCYFAIGQRIRRPGLKPLLCAPATGSVRLALAAQCHSQRG